MAKGVENRTANIYSTAVDFEKEKGNTYAVRLELTVGNAKNLVKKLKDRILKAEQANQRSLDLIAHWGKGTQKGYKIVVRVHRIDQVDLDSLRQLE